MENQFNLFDYCHLDPLIIRAALSVVIASAGELSGDAGPRMQRRVTGG
jgi:hypothetical protein